MPEFNLINSPQKKRHKATWLGAVQAKQLNSFQAIWHEIDETKYFGFYCFFRFILRFTIWIASSIDA